MLRPFRILGSEVRPDLNRVVFAERTVTLEPRVMQVLVRLAHVPGEVVSREDLNREVWGGAFVTDDALTRAVGEIRRVFDDDSRRPRVVETIPKRGYRLIAPVEGPDGEVAAPAGRRRPVAAGRRALALAFVLLALLAAAAGVAFIGAPDDLGPLPAPTRTLALTTGAEDESQPAISPDGRSVAFVRRVQGNDDLFVKRLGGDEQLRLTSHEADDRHPIWSPDGGQIAFIREGPGLCDVLTIAALGGGERRVARCGPDYHGLAWTAGGRQLYFAHRDGSGPYRLRSIAVDGAGARDLPAPPPDFLGDHSPAISPDGASIAFVRSYAARSGDVYVRALDGSDAPRRLTFDNRSIAGVDWWHDGRSLLFSSDRSGDYGLWRVAVSGAGEPQWVAGGALKLKHPSAARSRPVAVYEAWRYQKNVWGVDLGEGSGPRLVAGSSQWDMLASLSPDGSRLAFVSTRSGHPELWLSDADGGPAERVTSLGGPDVGQPSWSPDGGRLVFEARPQGASDLYVAELDTGVTRSLTSQPGDEVAPSWSPDGSLVYFGSRRGGTWQVWSVPSAGGPAQQVTRNGGVRARAAPAGGCLYFVKDTSRGLYRLGASGEEILVLPSLPLESWASWDVAADGIYVADETSEDGVRIHRIDPETLERSTVASLGRDFVSPGLSVSSDGRRLVYTRADRAESEVMYLELP